MAGASGSNAVSGLAPRVRSVRRPWLPWALIATLMTLILGVTALARPSWAIGTEPLSVPWSWLYPTATNSLWALAFVSVLVAAIAQAERDPRIGQHKQLLRIGVPAILTLLLGFATYTPCMDGSSVAALVAWVLSLFTGQVEYVFGPGTICPGRIPLGFQVARLLGLTTLVMGALATIAAVSRQQLDRWHTLRATDVDIVVGTDPDSVRLALALVVERDAQTPIPEWYDLSVSEARRVRRASRRQVVVIHNNRDDPALSELRAAGVRVLLGDARDRELLRVALLNGRKRRTQVAVHRLFATTPTQAFNLEVIAAAADVLDHVNAEHDGEWLWQASVPRLVALFDDAREARDWQLTNLGAIGYFLDAFSQDGLLARDIVAGLIDYAPQSIILIGDSPLTVALLDELALQHYFRKELDEHRADSVMPPLPTDGLNQISVTVSCPTAVSICSEWRLNCAPCGIDLDLISDPRDCEEAANSRCAESVRSAIILTEPPSAHLTALATRLSRGHPTSAVLAPNDNIDGVDPIPQAPSRTVVRFGHSLLQAGGVPEDSWTVLARQQHLWWGTADTDAGDDRAARRPWGTPSDPAESRLPEFYREDNLRQLRTVLVSVLERGWIWQPASAATSPATAGRLTAAERMELARVEHTRWYELRRTAGWRFTTEKATGDASTEEKHRLRERQERARLHADLIEWTDLTDERRNHNAEAIAGMIDRLYQWGITITRPDTSPTRRYRKISEVTAVRLAQQRIWSTDTGDTMTSKPGDWLITDQDGREWTVSADIFPESYEHVSGERYRGVGTVEAYRCTDPDGRDLVSREGVVHAQEGDWILTDGPGNSWPVSDRRFRATYALIES